LLLSISPAFAGELTRGQYVQRAEETCKPSMDRAGPILKVARRSLQKNKVKVSGRHFLQAAEIIRVSGEKLEAIPMPPDDTAVLKVWIERLREENELLKKIGEELLDAHRVKAQGYLARFVHSGNQANRVVFGFGFDQCLFRASRVF
jgi:hypothetical protein